MDSKKTEARACNMMEIVVRTHIMRTKQEMKASIAPYMNILLKDMFLNSSTAEGVLDSLYDLTKMTVSAHFESAPLASTYFGITENVVPPVPEPPVNEPQTEAGTEVPKEVEEEKEDDDHHCILFLCQHCNSTRHKL